MNVVLTQDVDKLGLRGEVVNVACGERVTLLDMIAVLNGLVGHEVPVEFVPPRPGEVRHSQAAIGRAAQLLDYRPVVDFREGMARTFAWYREQEAAAVFER